MMGDEPTRSESVSKEVFGSSWVAAKMLAGDELSFDLQTVVAGAIDELQAAYDKLFKKNQQNKTRQIADVQRLFDEQSHRIAAMSSAAEDLVLNLKKRKALADGQEDIDSRSRQQLEVAYNESQNDLIFERASNLELEQKLGKLHGSKILHDLLQSSTGFSISSYGESQVIFSHDETGFEFKLEQNSISKEVGGKDAWLYQVVAPGTLLHVAPDWMQSEIVFDMIQVPVFFQRIREVAHPQEIAYVL